MGKEIKKETIVIKIGTSALSMEDGMPDKGVLTSLVEQIAMLKNDGHNVILVSSGAVGIGRAKAKKRGISFEGCDPTAVKQICSGIGQPDLMEIYDKLLKKHGITRTQVLPTKSDFGINGGPSTGIRAVFKWAKIAFAKRLGFKVSPDPEFVRPLDFSMRHPKMLPIINENDMVTAREITFTDNDELAGEVTRLFNADRLILLSNVNGVETYRGSGQVIPVVNFANPMTLPESTEGTSSSGTGGMASKIRVAKRITALGIKTDLASSKRPNAVLEIVAGLIVGTRFTDTRYIKPASCAVLAPAP